MLRNPLDSAEVKNIKLLCKLALGAINAVINDHDLKPDVRKRLGELKEDRQAIADFQKSLENYEHSNDPREALSLIGKAIAFKVHLERARDIIDAHKGHLQLDIEELLGLMKGKSKGKRKHIILGGDNWKDAPKEVRDILDKIVGGLADEDTTIHRADEFAADMENEGGCDNPNCPVHGEGGLLDQLREKMAGHEEPKVEDYRFVPVMFGREPKTDKIFAIVPASRRDPHAVTGVNPLTGDHYHMRPLAEVAEESLTINVGDAVYLEANLSTVRNPELQGLLGTPFMVEEILETEIKARPRNGAKFHKVDSELADEKGLVTLPRDCTHRVPLNTSKALFGAVKNDVFKPFTINVQDLIVLEEIRDEEELRLEVGKMEAAAKTMTFCIPQQDAENVYIDMLKAQREYSDEFWRKENEKKRKRKK